MKQSISLLFSMVFLLLLTPFSLKSQAKNDKLTYRKAVGTGQTTGHIATLTIHNDSPDGVELPPKRVYIKRKIQYQPYVGYLPQGIWIDAGETVEVSIIGVCADVHKPPVPLGEEMPPYETWISMDVDVPFPKTSFFGDKAEYNVIADKNGPTQLMNKAQLIELMQKIKDEGFDSKTVSEKAMNKIDGQSPYINPGRNAGEILDIQKLIQAYNDEVDDSKGEDDDQNYKVESFDEDSEIVIHDSDLRKQVSNASANLARGVAQQAQEVAEAAAETVSEAVDEIESADDDGDSDDGQSTREEAVKGAAKTAKDAAGESEDASSEVQDAIAAAKAAKEKARTALEEAEEAQRLARAAADYADDLARRAKKNGEDEDGSLADSAAEARAAYKNARDAYRKAKQDYEDTFGETVDGDIIPKASADEPEIPVASSKEEKKNTGGESKQDGEKDSDSDFYPTKGPFTGRVGATSFSVKIGRDKHDNLVFEAPSEFKEYKNDEVLYGENMILAGTQIVLAADSLMNAGAIQTPFGGNYTKERETVVQQTFWMYAAGLSDDPYEKEDFQGRVYAQYAESNGEEPSKLSSETKEQLKPGVDAFWGTFTAVGLKAKVFSVDE